MLDWVGIACVSCVVFWIVQFLICDEETNIRVLSFSFDVSMSCSMFRMSVFSRISRVSVVLVVLPNGMILKPDSCALSCRIFEAA
jgi:hypothetical protein